MGLSGTRYTDRRTNGNGNVFIIATSSKPNDIDQAMRRPGERRNCGLYLLYDVTVRA